MKAVSGILILLAAVGAGRAAAQVEGIGDPSGRESPDSIGVSALDEQRVGQGGDDEIERDPGIVADGGRRAIWSARWRLRGSLLLQPAAGYLNGEYAGGRAKLYERFDLRRGKGFHAALLTEKDPGERSIADFVSGMIRIGGLPGGMEAVAGDYRIRSGQGLLFGSAMSFGKGASVIEPVLRRRWGMPDGLSADESDFFRGLALRAGGDPAEAIIFGSVRTRAPVLSPDGGLRGIDESGYHRTSLELGRRDRLVERSAGGLMRLRPAPWISAGAGVRLSRFELRGAGDAAAVPAPSGAMVRAASDLLLTGGPVTLFGEAVVSASRTPWIIAAMIEPGPGTRLLIAARHYPPSGDLARSYGFADRSSGENEEGAYLAVEMPVAGAYVLSGYIDLFAAVAPTAGAFFPPSGVDRSLSLRTAGGPLGLDARFRSRIAEVKSAGTEGDRLTTPGNGTRRTDRLRLGVSWSPAEKISCAIRLEASSVSPGARDPTDRGVMGGAELTARPARGVTAQARLELFRAASDAAGFRTVEADLPGTLAGNDLAGEGASWYLLVSCRPASSVGVSMKYSRFTRDDLRRIGSGSGELPSNIRERAAIQVDLAW